MRRSSGFTAFGVRVRDAGSRMGSLSQRRGDDPSRDRRLLEKVCLRMKPVTFLLVDDLAENLLSLEALLRRDGLALSKARSGDEALELLLEHEVALALIDVRCLETTGSSWRN